MIKKLLPLSIAVLVFVFIILILLQNALNKNNAQGGLSLTPTVYQGKQASGSSTQTEKKTYESTVKPLTSEELQKKLPIIAPDFTLDHSEQMQKYVVTTNDSSGQAAFQQWVGQNMSMAPLLIPGEIIFSQQSVAELNSALDYAEKNKLSPEQAFKKNTDAILSIVNTLFSPIVGPTGPVSFPTITPTATKNPGLQPTSNPNARGNGSYVYYAQCGGAYDNYLLPIQNGENGKKCTECSAGCGPTTASMIIASYVDSSQTPPSVIESMSKAGVSISCAGSGMYQLYGYMSKVQGLQVSTLLSLGHVEAKVVVPKFRNYIADGWTLFVLADCTYGGHYFWVTDVTAEGNILSYDPAYGSGRPRPFNENQYDPHPYYIYAFAVKKSSL